MTSKKKDLTIEQYKEELLDDIEETEELENKLDEYEEIEEKTPKKKNKTNLIINIIFIILVLIMIIISVDIVCVAKYNKGPFFAIKTTTYKDGGTKVYYGLGYKVIKYNQLQGRRDTEIGTWKLKYSTTPTEISSLDLAIEFTNNPNESYQKYYKKFLRVNGIVSNKDTNKNTLTITYNDEDGKYTLDIICTMAEKDSIPEYLEENSDVTMIGTLTDFVLKNDTQNQTIYISNCFAE